MATSYLFAYYTSDSEVSLSFSTSIKTGLFFFLAFCWIITPISGIINYYCYGKLKKKKKNWGENNNKLRKMYPNNREKV